MPELSVTTEKQRVVKRDILAIDNKSGQPPTVRLHKDAFSPANVTVVSWNTVTATPDAVQSGAY